MGRGPIFSEEMYWETLDSRSIFLRTSYYALLWSSNFVIEIQQSRVFIWSFCRRCCSVFKFVLFFFVFRCLISVIKHNYLVLQLKILIFNLKFLPIFSKSTEKTVLPKIQIQLFFYMTTYILSFLFVSIENCTDAATVK